MSQPAVQIVFELTEEQATALSEFLEYSTFSEFQRKAHHDIDRAHNMADAAARLRKTLSNRTTVGKHGLRQA